MITLEDFLYLYGLHFLRKKLLSHKIFLFFFFQLSFPSVLFNIRKEYIPSWLPIRLSPSCLDVFHVCDCSILVCNIFSHVINLLLTKLAQGHIGRIPTPVLFVWTLLCSVCTVKISGQYSPRTGLAFG